MQKAYIHYDNVQRKVCIFDSQTKIGHCFFLDIHRETRFARIKCCYIEEINSLIINDDRKEV